MSPGPGTAVDEDDLDPSDDEITTRNTLAASFNDISLYSGHDHFLGKSSSLMFLQTALDMKHEYVSPSAPLQARQPLLASMRPEFWHEHAVCRRTLHVYLRPPNADVNAVRAISPSG